MHRLLVLILLIVTGVLGVRALASEPSAARLTLLVVGQKSVALRTTDTLDTAHDERLETVAERVRLREQEDDYFSSKARYLGQRLQGLAGTAQARSEFALPKTGVEFLDALASASRRAPISNLVVYGHSGASGLFMMEDRGFYKSVRAIAEKSPLAEGTPAEREAKLRALGARDMSDLEALVRRGSITFARDAVIIFTGCSIAGATELEPNGIPSRLAEISGATVFGSVNLTDGSKADAPGASWDNENSVGTWIRFEKGRQPQDLNNKVLNLVSQLNLAPARQRATQAR